MIIDMNTCCRQSEFGQLIGASQQTVSDLLGRGVLSAGGTAGRWLLEYCGHLREVAAGRATAGDLDLAGERAALAKAQREGHEIRNAVALGTYAPIETLADVLARASAAVVDRLEQIPADLRRVCPDLPQAARDVVMAQIASARNEMVRKTASLLDDDIDPADVQEDEPAVDEAAGRAPSATGHAAG